MHPLTYGVPSSMLLFMPETVEQVIGQEIRRLREAAGVGQSAVAMYARQIHLPWTRATVAAIELGRKQLRLGELAVIPLVLHLAGVTDRCLLLVDLIPADDRLVDIWPGVRLPLRNARTRLLIGDDKDIRPTAADPADNLRDVQACGDAEQKAALTLRVTPRAAVDAAYELWGHSLSMERLLRLRADAAAATATPSRLRALMGHVTRELLDELRPVLKRAKKKSRRTRR